MFCAWREGRKTVTRRLVNPQPPAGSKYGGLVTGGNRTGQSNIGKGLFYSGAWPCPEETCYARPYYRPGEHVLVVTRWATYRWLDYLRPSELLEQEVGDLWLGESDEYEDIIGKWRPGRFVPKRLESLFPQTTILSVQAEWLQMTEAEAIREGFRSTVELTADKSDYCGFYAQEHFIEAWNTIHQDYPFESKPMVWRYEIAGPEDRR
jgi:hypothetical protein